MKKLTIADALKRIEEIYAKHGPGELPDAAYNEVRKLKLFINAQSK